MEPERLARVFVASLGMMVAFRSVFFTLVLLLLFTYVFSVAFVQFSRENEVLSKAYFGSMGGLGSVQVFLA